jgi:pimeloyl-ACP methyl ester carboxylesterase
MGYSEPGPLPRTAERFAEELHTLLLRADVPGPYVLVGHSLGGLTVRVFAHQHAADVAGAVLIDSMSPSQAKPSTSAMPTATDSHSLADWALTLPARTGLLRLLAGRVHATEDFSPAAANYYSVFWVSPRTLQAWLDEGKGTSESLAQAGAVRGLGALPLIVLSRGELVAPDPAWQRMQRELLELSSRSRAVVRRKERTRRRARRT